MGIHPKNLAELISLMNGAFFRDAILAPGSQKIVRRISYGVNGDSTGISILHFPVEFEYKRGFL